MGIRNVITRRRAVVVGAIVLLGTTIAVPVAALVARLTTIPLGPGTATITWTGRAGLRPTLTSIRGTVHGYKVIGSGQVPGIGSSSSGGAGAGGSIPSTLTLAKVNGQLGGSAFTLTIDLNLPNAGATGTTSNLAFGSVTGSFRGQPVHARLSAPNLESKFVDFSGTIGTYDVTGKIGQPKHHGAQETAHATFTVTRGSAAG